MNRAVFSDWCENVVFPTIQKTGQKSVFVLDEEDRRPTQAWNKSRLCFAIKRRGGPPAGWIGD